MSITLQVGEFVAYSFVVKNSDGSVNATAVASAAVGDLSKLRARINPDDSRQVGVLALAQSPGINATVSALGHSMALTFVIPPPPDLTAVVIDTSSGTPTTAVPSWML